MIVLVMWEVISNGHVCTYEPRSAQCSLPLCALCPYSVLRTLCRRFMSIIFFQHQAAAHALVSRRSVFFAFCLPLFCLLFALSTCFRFLLLASLPSSLSFLTRQLLSSTNVAMLFCLCLYKYCVNVCYVYVSLHPDLFNVVSIVVILLL